MPWLARSLEARRFGGGWICYFLCRQSLSFFLYLTRAIYCGGSEHALTLRIKPTQKLSQFPFISYFKWTSNWNSKNSNENITPHLAVGSTKFLVCFPCPHIPNKKKLCWWSCIILWKKQSWSYQTSKNFLVKKNSSLNDAYKGFTLD